MLSRINRQWFFLLITFNRILAYTWCLTLSPVLLQFASLKLEGIILKTTIYSALFLHLSGWDTRIFSVCRHRIFVSVPRTHAANRKGPLDGADPPCFSARVVHPAQSFRDVPVNLTLQLTRRESSSAIKDGTCRCCQTVPNVWLWEPIWKEID